MTPKCPYHQTLPIEASQTTDKDTVAFKLRCVVCGDKMTVIGRGDDITTARTAAEDAWQRTAQIAIATVQLQGGSLRYAE